jgi:hypothetical protein
MSWDCNPDRGRNSAKTLVANNRLKPLQKHTVMNFSRRFIGFRLTKHEEIPIRLLRKQPYHI